VQADVAIAPRSAAEPIRGVTARRRTGTAGGWAIPAVADVVFLICLVGALVTAGRMISADGDPGRHLAVGEHILRSGAIPRRDVFSHTMGGTPFVPYEWLAEVSSALSYRLAGWAGPVLLHGGVIGLSFGLLFGQIRARGVGLLLALAVTAMAMTTSAVHWLARPHVFTFLGTAVFAVVLDRWRAGTLSRRWLWALPAAMAVWANAHGGFLVAFLLMGAYAAADALRLVVSVGERRAAARRLGELAVAGLATLGATLLNPAGVGLLEHVTGYFGKQLLVDNTHEYMSPNFHEKTLWLFAGMVLLTAAGAAWSPRRPALQEGFLFLGFAFCGLYAARNIPLFAIVAAPLLASQLAALRVEPEWDGALPQAARAVLGWLGRRDRRYSGVDARARGHAWGALALAGLCVLAARQHAAGLSPLGARIDPKRQPVEAVAYLKQMQPAGNVFNEFGWGGYLLHEMWPSVRVFIDGQTDFYGEALTSEYMQVGAAAPGWEAILDKYGVRWALLPSDSRLARELGGDPGWRVEYRDGFATVLVRNAGAIGGRS
jgi:hypothetical protein